MEKEMEMICLLSHPHPLRFSRLAKDGEHCKICKKELLSPLIYSCEKCKYFICELCAKLPQQIKHPFHPDHTLVLCNKSPLCCSACAHLDSGYGYDCNQCSFTLHLKCAALKPTDQNKDLALKSLHKHPVILCEKPSEYSYECFRCHSLIQDDHLFVCLQCNYMLDQWCAAQPNEIRHPFHPDHPLKLLPRAPALASDCSLCGMGLDFYTAVYNCRPCNFNVDVHCTTLMPVRRHSDPDQDQEQVEIQAATHSHPLIQCYTNIKNFSRECYGCGLPFEGFINVCLQCGFLLHKSCANLPREILHPFHIQHSLTLFENLVETTLFGHKTHRKVYHSSDCKGCRKGSGSFVYICHDCSFLLDVRCAIAKFPAINSMLHPHPLFLLDIGSEEFRCNICRLRCPKFFFRCVKCDFNIHFHCHPSLPQTIKHSCHCDPLTFSTSKIKDFDDEDEDQEFYCNACEENRNLADPTYYCEQCHFVAHVHCVISEILPVLQSDSKPLEDRADTASTSGAKEDDAMVQSALEAAAATTKGSGQANADAVYKLDEEIAALEEEIDAMTEELQELWDTRIQYVAALQYMIKTKIRLTGNNQEATDIASYVTMTSSMHIRRAQGKARSFAYCHLRVQKGKHLQLNLQG